MSKLLIRACFLSVYIVLLSVLAGCGGSGSGPGPVVPPGNQGISMNGGGDACGAQGCSADNIGGTGPGGDGSASSAGGSESALRNVNVVAYKPDGTVLGSAPLTNNLVSLFPVNFNGAFILKFVDSGNGQYWDEAKKDWLSLQGETLHIMVPTLAHHLSVNALTEAAYQLALKQNGSEAALTAALMQRANDTVLAQFNAKLANAYKASDITNFATSIDDTSGPGTLPNTHAGRLSAVLAALPIAAANFNSQLSAPALSYGRQLIADIVDDGLLNNSVQVSNPAYGASQINQLAAGVCTAIANWGSAAMPSPHSGTAATTATPGQLTLLAGNTGGSGNCDGIGANARFNFPSGVALDAAGNIYTADTYNNTIRKVTAAGIVTTTAGLAGASGSSDGTTLAARFNLPAGIAVDSAGTIYLADTFNHTIRKLTAAGVVSTLAGATRQTGSTDGVGTAARFQFPGSVAVDAAGNVYVADTFNHTIRKITAAGVVSTLAGLAGQGFSVDGTGSAARFNFPYGIALGSGGVLLVADTFNNTIRRVTAAGVVSTLAGNSALPAGSSDGTGAAARFNAPQAVAVDPAGNTYVADTENQTIRKITASGVVTTFAGTASIAGGADGTASAAQFSRPSGLSVDANGVIYVADYSNHTIRKITATRVVTTIAGAAPLSGSVDGTGAAARFNTTGGVAIDVGGNVYVADQENHTIRKITAVGLVTTMAGGAGQRGSADGVGTAARFDTPIAVAVDAAGSVYVADNANSTIRKVSAAGVVTTLAGSAGSVNGSVDGTGAQASFSSPTGIALDLAGNLFVADRSGQVIRKVTPGGVVTTVAGSGDQRGSADGIGAAARFLRPHGIAVDLANNLYVSEEGNLTIRKITAAGVVTTLAGSTGQAGSTDGAGAAARFQSPFSMTVDQAGNLLVGDANRVRKVTPTGTVSTVVGTASGAGIELGALPATLGRVLGVALASDQKRLAISSENAVLLATPVAAW